jgi:hypothetical protein
VNVSDKAKVSPYELPIISRKRSLLIVKNKPLRKAETYTENMWLTKINTYDKIEKPIDKKV